MMISELEDDIDLKQAELQSAEDYVTGLRNKYIKPTYLDRSKSQCSKCHLRDGHNRRQCSNGECPGPEYCNDMEKHPLERKTLHDATNELRAKEKELASLKQDHKNKVSALNETRSSFKYKIETALILIWKKYTFYTSRGRTPRQTNINNDTFILEKHYRGRVPVNIADEARKFQKIIDDFNKVNSCTSSCSRAVNPEKRLLENHGIIYPETVAKTYDVQARQKPVVNDGNVWDSYSRKVPPKKTFSVRLS